MESRNYLALIGDVVSSRTHGERPELQEWMLETIAEINEALGPDTFAAPLTLTAGDECQALLRRPEEIVGVIQELTDRRFGSGGFPYLLFGVGRGPIATGPLPPPPEQAPNPALLDGPCFHAAREALGEARARQVWARFRGFTAKQEPVLNALFDLMGAIRSKWKAKQGVYSYEERLHPTQREVARAVSVSPSVVSESLKAAHHETILAGEAAARAVLEGVLDDPTGEDRGC